MLGSDQLDVAPDTAALCWSRGTLHLFKDFVPDSLYVFVLYNFTKVALEQCGGTFDFVDLCSTLFSSCSRLIKMRPVFCTGSGSLSYLNILKCSTSVSETNGCITFVSTARTQWISVFREICSMIGHFTYVELSLNTFLWTLETLSTVSLGLKPCFKAVEWDECICWKRGSVKSQLLVLDQFCAHWVQTEKYLHETRRTRHLHKESSPGLADIYGKQEPEKRMKMYKKTTKVDIRFIKKE